MLLLPQALATSRWEGSRNIRMMFWRGVCQALGHLLIASHFSLEEVDIDKKDAAGIAEAALELMGVDISEVFNPARFTALAGVLGLALGFVADAAVLKGDGLGEPRR